MGRFHARAEFAAEDGVRGRLHEPTRSNGDVILRPHGAGADCSSKLLVALANAFEELDFAVVRYDLPFRQERRHRPTARGFGEPRRRCVGRRNSEGAFFWAALVPRTAFADLVAEEPQIAGGLLLLNKKEGTTRCVSGWQQANGLRLGVMLSRRSFSL